MYNRDAEDTHDAIADELVKGAAQLLDLRAEPQVVRAQESPNVFRVCLVGAGRKADQVTEENGDDLRSSVSTCPLPSGVPHPPQNRKPSGFTCPHI